MENTITCTDCNEVVFFTENESAKLCPRCKKVLYNSKAEDYSNLTPEVQRRIDNTVIRASEELLKQDPTAIIINEEVAMKYRLEGIANAPSSYLLQNIEMPPMGMLEDFRYSHLTKKEREAVIYPVRTEPKIQRNESCPCGSGKKYKHCCINK